MTVRDAAADGAAELLDLIEGKWTTQAIGVAAELGIADLIASGTKRLPELASATACHAGSLRRLLQALQSLGLCVEEDGRYALTSMGQLLESDAQPSLRAWARWGARHHWDAWGHLLESVQSGKSARTLAGEAAGYAHLQADAAKAATFNRAMVEVTALVAAAAVRVHDFSGVKRVADIGGGYGELLCRVLESHPHLEGVLFDLPHAMDGARARLESSGLMDRCELVPGSFFDAVPPGCDVYMMKSIVHNWDDQSAEQILGACRSAMPDHGRALLLERVMPRRLTGEHDQRRIVRADLNMLVTHAGRERTEEEFESLLARAGLVAQRFQPLAVGFSLIEASIA
jgi:orsellinic acid C2-O-methyltransferase